MPPQLADEAADDFKRRVGEAIRSVRGEMKQGSLAELLGTDQSTVSGWESGRYMPPLQLFPVIEELCGARKGAIVRRLNLVDDDVVAVLENHPDLDEWSRRAAASYYVFIRDKFDSSRATP